MNNNSEKLNLWDRFFNRYRQEIIEEGKETWFHHLDGVKLPYSEYTRSFVKYKITDRLTGSVTIKKVFL